jgi:hypothetical protein
MQGFQTSHDQRAFDSYLAFSARVGNTNTRDFEHFYCDTNEINPSLAGSHQRFHKPTIGNHGTREQRRVPADQGWNGSWDNAVRMIEDAA